MSIELSSDTDNSALAERATTQIMRASISKRHAAEKRFRMLGFAAVIFGILALFALLASILYNGLSSFQQTYFTLEIHLDEKKLDKNGNRDPADLAKIKNRIA